MKRWKERLSRFLGSKDRPELDQAEQRGWQHRQQPQGLPPNVPRSNGKPPRRPPAPMSQGSVRGSRASYDNSMLGRPSGSSRHPAFGPGGAGLEPKGTDMDARSAKSMHSMHGEMEPGSRRTSFNSTAGSENGPMNNNRKKGTADLKGAMLHRAPQPMPAPSSSLAPALEERASSLVDRYLPPSRASFQGGAGSYPGSYTGSHTGSLAAQTPLAAGTSSPFSTQDRGNHFQRAGSGLSVVPGSQVTFSGSDLDLEGLAHQLQAGTLEERGAAAERLFSHAAENERNRSHVASLGVTRPLVALLWEGQERGRMYAAYALSALMTPQSPVDSLLAAGLVPALLSVLQTSRALATKKGAMRALGRLARSDEAASELVAAEGLPPMIALLDCSDPGLVRRCLVALYFVGADKAALQAAMASAGAVAPTVRLCRSSHPEVQAEAADVLKVLARSASSAQAIVDLDGLDVLNRVASNGLSPRSRTSAVKAIQRLAAHPKLAARVCAVPAGSHVGASQLQRAGSGASTSSQIPPVPAGVRDQRFAEDQAQAQDMAELPLRVPAKNARGPLAMQPVVAQPEVRGDAQGVGPLVDMLDPMQDAQSRAYAAHTLAGMASPDRPAMGHAMLQLGAPEGLVHILRDFSSDSAACISAAVALERIASIPGTCQDMPHVECADAAQQALQHGPLGCHAPCLQLQHHLLHSHSSLGLHLLDEGALPLLIKRLAHGSEDVRLAALELLLELAELNLPITGCVPVLAALERSMSADVRGYASSVLALLSSARSSSSAVHEHRELQGSIGTLLTALRSTVAISPAVEEAMRMVPRSLFLPHGQGALAWQARPVLPSGLSLILGSPQAEALALQAVGLEVGNSVLDVGSGSGYLTTLASHLAADAGSAVGIEIRDEAVDYAEECSARHTETFQEATPPATFLRGNVFSHPKLEGRKFDRILVGAACPRSRLRDLLRLLRPGGKMAALCEGQLLLLAQPSVQGPIPEPAVLGAFAAADSLVDGSLQAPQAGAQAGPKQELMDNPFKRHAGAAANGHDPGAGQPPRPFAHPPKQANGHAKSKSGDTGRSGNSNEEEEGFNSEEVHGWFISWEDIRICRNAEGYKCRLGEGGFGIVYKAHMNGVDEVAVKLVKADQPSAREMALFHKEVRVLRKLHHRNIVQFYGACLEPGAMFFVTELMKGGDLYSALRHHADTMRWDRLGRKVATDVALGINYLHTRRPPMMHRDLKSPNVLLSEEGVAKIADVGMVRAQVQDLVTAQPVMTPLWAAPEVVRHERASIKADIWSYGILIWELISGQDITELQPLAIARQQQRKGGHADRPTLELPPMAPPIAAHLFLECTETDPEKRPTASKIVEWLRSS